MILIDLLQRIPLLSSLSCPVKDVEDPLSGDLSNVDLRQTLSSTQQTHSLYGFHIGNLTFTWQNCIFFAAMIFTICIIAKKIFTGDLLGTFTHTGLLAALFMGKCYTDSALENNRIKIISDKLAEELQASAQHVIDLQRQIHLFTSTNKEHAQQVRKVEKLLKQHELTLERLKQDIHQENQRKAALDQDLEKTRRNLSLVQEEINEATRTLTKVVQKVG